MLSKYAETATNINSIEHIVEGLMTELGIGGFMGVEDLRAGMKVMLCQTITANIQKSITVKL